MSAIAVLALHGSGPPYSDVAAAVLLAPLLAYLIKRGAAVSLVADRSGVVIRNPYRTYSLAWADIEKVEPSRQSAIGGNWEPVILFRTTSGRQIKARAARRPEVEANWDVEQILALAPGHVAMRSEPAPGS